MTRISEDWKVWERGNKTPRELSKAEDEERLLIRAEQLKMKWEA